MSDLHTELWGNILGQIKGEVSDQVFNAWFIPIAPVSVSDNKLVLGVPNEFFKDWMHDRYLSLLDSHLHKLNKEINIEFTIIDIPESTIAAKDPKVALHAAEDSDGKSQKGWFRSVFPKQGEDGGFKNA